MDIFNNAQQAWLVLEDGTVYEGYGLGSSEDAIGELVFNTSVVGFQEILTDPANANNIIVETFPLTGNYGVNHENDLHESITARGWVAQIKAWKKPMPAWVNYNEKVSFEKLDSKYSITMVNYGIRKDVINALMARGCRVTVVPASYTEKEIMETKPDAVVLCGGAGLEALRTDYAQKENAIDAAQETVAALMKSGVPVLGIDFGHQIMALAMDGSVEKMHCGHRGANCPVTEIASGRTFITSQNHGYIVKNIPASAVVSHVNSNDKTCEGLEYPQMKAMSVQFIPESEIGQKNFDGIYERFLGMVK